MTKHLLTLQISFESKEETIKKMFFSDVKNNFCFAFIFSLVLLAVGTYQGALGQLASLNPSPEDHATKLNWTKNPFDLKAFIENKGQFDNGDSVEGSEIKFAIFNQGIQYYFTSKGWTYRHDESRELTEEEIIGQEKSIATAAQEGEEEERRGGKTVSYFVHMDWKGANTDARITAEEPVAPYFTYSDLKDKSGKSGITAVGYSKIIYHDLYPGIDVEYTFPENKPGIKYALIVHPGADVSVIKMHYSGMSSTYIDEEGNIQIVPMNYEDGNLVDHAPISYYKDGTSVTSGFNVSGSTISFSLDKSQVSNLKSQILIIDPWTSNPISGLNAWNSVYDINYDNAGNVYVYGGGYPWNEIKFNSAGVMQWFYSTVGIFYGFGCNTSSFTHSSACYGDFAVDASSESSYIVEAFNGGAGVHVIKLNGAGSQVRLFTPLNNNLSEMWRVQFNNCTQQAVIAGGGTSRTYQACLLDTNVTTMMPVNVLNTDSALHDFTLLALDNYGNCFMATAERYQNDGLFDNVLVKCPASTLVPVSYIVPDNHTFIEVHSISYVEGVTSQANGYNGIAVDNNYVYTYDGNVLKKWNKSNGTLKGSTTLGGTAFASGGLDVNGCGDIFVGIGSSIKQLDSAFNLKNTYATTNAVHDLKLAPGNLIYACGDAFVSAISITSTSCGNLNLSVSTTPDSCAAKGTATVTVAGGVGPYTYSWSPSGKTTQSIAGLSAGSYTVTVTDLAFSPCSNTSGGTQTIAATVPSSTGSITVSPSSSICTGSSATLTASGGTTYTWSPTTGLSSGSGATVTANPASTTTYTVTGSNGSGCTGTASVTVTVNSLPTIGVSPASPSICNGQSVTLTGSGGTSYTWSPASGLSAVTGTTVSANPSATTTYTVTGTNANGCSNTKGVTVTVNPLPIIGVTPTAPVLCKGQSTSLMANGGNSYIWSPASGLSATTGTTVTANPASTTTYTVTGTDNNGCSNTKSVTVTINPLPTITVNPATPAICNGGSVSLVAAGGTSYVWSPSIGLSAITGATVIANPTATTLYTVTGTDGNGCSNTKSVTVMINPLPAININPVTPVCTGQSVVLSAGGGSTYIWGPPTGLSATTGSTVSAGPGTTTTYTVTGTDINGCSNTKSITVTINPLPIITASPNSPALCNGASVVLTAGGGSTYAWSPSAGLSATTGTTVSATPSSTTTYIITGTDANGCSNTTSVTVSVIQTPLVTISPVTPICKGQSATLIANGAITYTWSPSTGLSATTGSTVTAIPTATTTYTVTGTIAGGCSASQSITVTVNPIPVITVSPSTPAICSGGSVSLIAGGGTSYVWSPSTGLSSTTGSTVSAGPSSTTTYTVTGTDANGCSNPTGVTVTINPLPTIIISPTIPVICSGGSTFLTASGATGFLWSPSTGLSATTGSTVNASPSLTSTYTVTGTDLNGCSNTKSVTVTVNPLPVVAINPGTPAICKGGSVSLNAGGGTSYAWSPSAGLSATTGATVIASPSSTTIYTVTGTDANGCSNTKSVIVTINALPVISINPVTPVCAGQSVVLAAGGGSTYIWGPSTGLSTTTGSTVSAGPPSTTTYTVTGTDNNGCSNSNSIIVTINPLPTITASPNLPSLCNGASVTLTAGGGSTYSWSPSTGLSATSGISVSADPSSTTTYIITGTDVNGCSNTGSVTVSVIQTPLVTVSPVTPICNGQSAMLIASGAITYAWSPATGLSATTGSSLTANPTTTTTYMVTGTIAGGCSASTSVTVTVSPLPVITASPSTPFICIGNSVSISASGGNSYIWSPLSGLSSGTGTTVSANPTSTTAYTVTGTDSNGCTDTASVTVTVNPLPRIMVSPATPILCNGQSVALTAGGGTSYFWSPTTGLSAGSGEIVSANPIATTTYNVTGTDGNGCSNTASVTVTVNPLPVITASPTTPAICYGAAVSLSANGGVSYIWIPTAGLSSGTGDTVSASPSTTTTYIVTGTDANGCSNSAGVTVTVNPLPPITASPSAPFICVGKSISITASGGNTYIWNPVIGLSSGTGDTVSANPGSNTAYTVTGSDANGCTNTASVTVTVNSLPVITASPATPILCNGQSVTLIAGGGTSYVWSPTSGLSSGSGATVSATPTATTTYNVTGTDGNGCSDTANVTITVNPLPIISASPATPAICYGMSVSLSANGGISYIWSPTAGLSSGTGSTVVASPSTTTTYLVTGTDGNGCPNAASILLTVNPLPVITVIPPAPSICMGNSISLTASGGNTYSWSPKTGLSSGTGATVTANPTTTSTYIVTGTDGNSCSNTTTITVTVNLLPVVNPIPDATICQGASTQLNVTGPPPGSTYTWSPSSDLSCNNCSNPSAKPATTTSYTVLVIDSAGCSASKAVKVIVLPLTVSAGPDTAVCLGSPVQLHASGGTGYLWKPSAGLDTANIPNPVAIDFISTTYSVAVSSASCTGTATVTISIFPDIIIPVIQQSGDTLSCSYSPAYKSYQWYYNDTIIPNATHSFYLAPRSGNYNVAVQDTNGCSISVGVNIVLTGISAFSSHDAIALYPNPASNLLTIYGQEFTAGRTFIEMYDILGQKVYSRQFEIRNSNSKIEVDVSGLAAGVYVVEAQQRQNKWVRRFVKE